MIEFGNFHKHAIALLGEEGYAEFIVFIAQDPEAGDLITGTGGFRKVRFARPGAGKRGGVRVIYFYGKHGVFLYMVYAKNELANLTAAQKHMLHEAAQILKGK